MLPKRRHGRFFCFELIYRLPSELNSPERGVRDPRADLSPLTAKSRLRLQQEFCIRALLTAEFWED